MPLGAKLVLIMYMLMFIVLVYLCGVTISVQRTHCCVIFGGHKAYNRVEDFYMAFRLLRQQFISNYSPYFKLNLIY